MGREYSFSERKMTTYMPRMRSKAYLTERYKLLKSQSPDSDTQPWIWKPKLEIFNNAADKPIHMPSYHLLEGWAVL
jgi:hypothetical protein